jgi:hypothetical protein
MLGLDVNELFRLAAQNCLQNNKAALALILFRLGKVSTLGILCFSVQCLSHFPFQCRAVERMRLLLQNGLIPEATICLHQLLDSHHPRGQEISTFDRSALSVIALPCFIYELISDQNQSEQLKDKFKSFLLNTFSFNKNQALELLVRFKLNNLLLNFSVVCWRMFQPASLLFSNCFQGRGLVADAINLIIQPETHSTRIQAADLAILLQLLFTIELDELLFLQPDILGSLQKHLEALLPNLTEDKLVQYAEIFDPLHYLSLETRLDICQKSSYDHKNNKCGLLQGQL